MLEPDDIQTPNNEVEPIRAPGDKRYSLKEMQSEIKLDRAHSAFSRELLNRIEIDKIFKERRKLFNTKRKQ